MKDKTRNLLVGSTVIIALGLLGGMIVIFQELPEFLQVGYQIKVRFPNASGVREGSDVLLAGRRIGRVTRVEFTEGDARKGITFTLLIEPGVNVPGDVNAYVRSPMFGGGAYIDLVPDRPWPRTDPATGEPMAWMPRDRVVLLEGKSAAGSELGRQIRRALADVAPPGLSDDIRDTLVSVRDLANTLNSFLTPPSPTTATAPTTTTATRPAPPNIYTTLAKLDTALDAVNKTLGDPENQANLKAGIDNFQKAAAAAGDTMREARDFFGKAKITFRDVSDAAQSASKRFDTLAAKLIDDADRLGKALTHIHRAAEKLEAGEGSAGRFINDPALYENLLEATDQMKITLEALQKLLAQWKEQGVKVKL